MPAAAVSLAKQLLKELVEQSKDKGVLDKIVSLSASDDAFVTAPKNVGFATAWPADLPLDTEGFTEAFLGLVSTARSVDPRLQKRSDRLVPKKTDEPGCAAPSNLAPRHCRSNLSRGIWAGFGAATSGI